MDRKYKIFQKGFNKVFDLIETADNLVIDDYKKFVGNLPIDIVMKMLTCEDFNIDNEKFNADMVRLVNEIDFEFIRYKNYFKTNFSVHRIFEEDLYKDEVFVRLFEFSYRNTEQKPDALKIFFEENNGQYIYKGNNLNQNENIIDVSCEVYLERIDDDFYLTSKRTFRGAEVYEKVVPVTFDEVIQCVEDEDDYEEDIEIELDFDL